MSPAEAKKTAAIGDFLTDEEIQAGITMFEKDEESFHDKFRDEIIKPIMDRINRDLGHENDPDYLTYCVEFAFYSARSH